MDGLCYTNILSTSLKVPVAPVRLPRQNVSAANVTKGNTINDRYSSPAEYAKLTNEQQEQLHQARAKCGYVKGTKDSKVLPSQATKKQNSEGNMYLRHLLTDCILPKSVTIFLVNMYTVIEQLQNFDSILVSALLIVSIHWRHNLIALCEYIPPCKSGFVMDVARDGKLSYLDRIRFLQVSESFPRSCAVLPLDAEFPAFGHLLVMLITIMRVDVLFFLLDSCGFVLLPVNSLIEM
jgi:hypothetical protein